MLMNGSLDNLRKELAQQSRNRLQASKITILSDKSDPSPERQDYDSEDNQTVSTPEREIKDRMSRYNRNGGSDFFLKQNQVAEIANKTDLDRAAKLEMQERSPYGLDNLRKTQQTHTQSNVTHSEMSRSQLGFGHNPAGSNRSSSELVQIKNIRDLCAIERKDVKHIKSVVNQEVIETGNVIDSVKSVQEALQNLETVDEYALPRIYQHRLLLDLNERLVEKTQVKEFKKERSKMDPSNKMFKWERKAARSYAINFKLQR